MSDLGLPMAPEDEVPTRSRHRGRSVLAVLISLVVLVGIGFGVRAVIGLIPELGGGPEDYIGEGTGQVTVEVVAGQTTAEIGQVLKQAGVIASVEAWLDEARSEPAVRSIGPGTYAMKRQMSAEAAVALMIDPSTRVVDKLLLREGLRIWESVAAISDATGLTQRRVERAATSNGRAIGLPSYAGDFAEGFLFPATYELQKGETSTEVLSRLVDRWAQAAANVGLVANARKMGRTPYEIMIIASLIQSEGHPDDFGKVSRVIYNRLDEDTWDGTNGFLELDATVNYALKKSDINLPTDDVRGTDSPYNTYKYPGLPPTPINSPGEAAIAAALDPEPGPWLWYVTVNPDTGETKFTDDYDEFLVFRSEFQRWLDNR